MEVKYKRKKVDWYSVRLELGDPDVEYYYWLSKSVCFDKGKKKLSLNRASYYALRHIYGDQVLKVYRLTGDLSCFYVMQ